MSWVVRLLAMRLNHLPTTRKCARNVLVFVALQFALVPRDVLDASSLDGDASVFDELTVVAPAELQSLRGGFSVGGLELEFGARIRTQIDGVSLLESRFTFTPDGPQLASVSGELAGTVNSANTVAAVASDPSIGVSLPALPQGVGVVANDPRGATLAVHEVTRERILSVLVSRASGIAARNDVNIDVTIQNFRDFQAAVRNAVLSNRIGRENRP